MDSYFSRGYTHISEFNELDGNLNPGSPIYHSEPLYIAPLAHPFRKEPCVTKPDASGKY